MPDDPLGIVDPSGLTDADWKAINKLRTEYERGGSEALDRALKELSADPVCYVRVMGAFFPHQIRETIKDQMAEKGITEEDLREMARNLASPSRERH